MEKRVVAVSVLILSVILISIFLTLISYSSSTFAPTNISDDTSSNSQDNTPPNSEEEGPPVPPQDEDIEDPPLPDKEGPPLPEKEGPPAPEPSTKTQTPKTEKKPGTTNTNKQTEPVGYKQAIEQAKDKLGIGVDKIDSATGAAVTKRVEIPEYLKNSAKILFGLNEVVSVQVLVITIMLWLMFFFATLEIFHLASPFSSHTNVIIVLTMTVMMGVLGIWSNMSTSLLRWAFLIAFFDKFAAGALMFIIVGLVVLFLLFTKITHKLRTAKEREENLSAAREAGWAIAAWNSLRGVLASVGMVSKGYGTESTSWSGQKPKGWRHFEPAHAPTRKPIRTKPNVYDSAKDPTHGTGFEIPKIIGNKRPRRFTGPYKVSQDIPVEPTSQTPLTYKKQKKRSKSNPFDLE